MNLLQQTRKFLITLSLLLLLGTTTLGSLAPQPLAQADGLLLANNLENRIEAASKNVEGKFQEAIGNITGDPQQQAAGKAKQTESQARNAVEDAKDNLRVKGRAKAVNKNLEGKAQEAFGKISDDPQQQAAGKAKQTESQARNTIENLKDSFK